MPATPNAARPLLPTPRLLLRAFLPWDAETVQRLAGARDVAMNTLNIPHPYPDGAADEWISSHERAWENGHCLVLAVTTESDGVVGAVSLDVDARHHRGDLGYWIGQPYWGRGYATEAARALLEFGFGELMLNRIQAHHLTRNRASGRVLEKLGMSFEGTRREHLHAWGSFEDVSMFGLLRSEHFAL